MNSPRRLPLPRRQPYYQQLRFLPPWRSLPLRWQRRRRSAMCRRLALRSGPVHSRQEHAVSQVNNDSLHAELVKISASLVVLTANVDCFKTLLRNHIIEDAKTAATIAAVAKMVADELALRVEHKHVG